MKRSEMIKKINKAIWDNVDCSDEMDFSNVPEKILKAIEEAGMLPPPIYMEMFKKHDNAWEKEDV